MNKVYCELCNDYVHKNSVWKHNRSDKLINIPRYEQIDHYYDIVEFPEWLFKKEELEDLLILFI